MITRIIEIYINRLICLKKYPTTKIAFNSRIDRETTFGKQVTIGRSSSISKSNLGNNIFIYSNCYLSKVSMGSFSYVAANSRLSSVKLGSFCSIGSDIICGIGEHPTDFLSTNPVFYSTLKQCGVAFSDKDYFKECKEVYIGNDVWIGARVFIRNGVKIGDGAIIAAGAVVTKDVPDYAIFGGVPAKLIRFRFSSETISELLSIKWWSWSEQKLRTAQYLFTTNDINLFIQWAKENSHIE